MRLLCGGLSRAGHDVTLFAPPGSDVARRRRDAARAPHPDEIQKAQFEADHVARAFARDRRRRRARGAVRRRSTTTSATPRSRWPTGVAAPLVHTLHGPFDRGRAAASTPTHGAKACIVGDLAGAARRRAAGDGRRPRRAQPDRLRRVAVPGGQGGLPALDRADVARQGPAPRDRRRARGRRAGRARRARSSRARRSTSPSRSSRRSATASSTWGRPTRDRKRELYGARPRAADADPLARAVRPRDGRGARVRHAGDRVPRGLGAGGRRGRPRPASSSRTSTRWRPRSAGWTRSTPPPAARLRGALRRPRGGGRGYEDGLPRRHDRPRRSGFCVRVT